MRITNFLPESYSFNDPNFSPLSSSKMIYQSLPTSWSWMRWRIKRVRSWSRCFYDVYSWGTDLEGSIINELDRKWNEMQE